MANSRAGPPRIHYAWIIAGVTFLVLLATAGTVGYETLSTSNFNFGKNRWIKVDCMLARIPLTNEKIIT